MYQNVNAWREILARIFATFTEQDNVSPDWLVNPATRRRLKLDKFYPEASIAVRFVGILAKGQGRQSDWELQESEQRDQTRMELCRLNGVQLLLIDPAEETPKQLDNLVRTLSRASRMLAQSHHPPRHKQQWMPALNTARETALALRSRIAKDAAQMMNNLAESWLDREAALVHQRPAAEPRPPQISSADGAIYRMDQRVRHERFGEGIITGLSQNDDDTTVTILFDAAQERTFLLSLVHDKLTPL